MAKVRVVPHQAAIDALERDTGVHRGLRPNADAVLQRARDNAPVLTGAYRDGLHIEDVEVDGALGYRIAGDSDHDIYVEADTGNLSRALDAAGDV